MFRSLLEMAAGSRDMAKHVRLLAEQAHDDSSKLRLERYATELDYKALKLEQAAARLH
jgi:hypothetical protein